MFALIKTTLKIDGMMCGMCEAHINDCIRNTFKVKKVTSSHTKNQCIIISEEELDHSALKHAIDKTGYTLVSVRSEPYAKKGLFSVFRK